MGCVTVGPQQPEAAVLPEFQDIFSCLIDEVVLAVAEEGEVAFVQPSKQVLGLSQLGDLGGMGNLVEGFGYLPRLVAHFRPVLNGCPDVSQYPFQAFSQARLYFLAGAANLHGDPRFHVGGVVTLGDQVGQTG